MKALRGISAALACIQMVQGSPLAVGSTDLSDGSAGIDQLAYGFDVSSFASDLIERRGGDTVLHELEVRDTHVPRNNAAAIDEPYWWMTDPKFQHKIPLSNSTQPVFRNVKDFGAKGDGSTDDWKAIMDAMSAGGRCGPTCNSTSTEQAIVYFPPGSYRITKPISLYYFTTMIGHPKHRPTIIGDPSFKGPALIDADYPWPGTPFAEGGPYYNLDFDTELWTENHVYFRQLRNFDIDMTEMPGRVEGGMVNAATGIHWNVKRASVLNNVKIMMPDYQKDPNVQHQGIFMGEYTEGLVSNLTLIGGRIPFVSKSAELTIRDARFSNCGSAIILLSDSTFVLKDSEVVNCDQGVDAFQGGVESIAILDSTFKNATSSIGLQLWNSMWFNRTSDKSSETPAFNLVLDNVHTESTRPNATALHVLRGKNSYYSRPTGEIAGPPLNSIYGRSCTSEVDGCIRNLRDDPVAMPRNPTLAAGSKYFAREQPQYEDLPESEFLSVLSFGAFNDRTNPHLNAIAINKALVSAAEHGKVLVFPAGQYLVDDTVFVPTNSRIAGASWSQIIATGTNFQSSSTSKILVKVGNPGDHGKVEISDLMLTNAGRVDGSVYMEWNVHEDFQGSAAMWNVVIRPGGAIGTGMQKDKCAHSEGHGWPGGDCMAGKMLLHVTKQASIYMENSWFSAAGYDLDVKAGEDGDGLIVYTGRGVLVESQGPSWIYGSISENSLLYQWQFSGAANVFMASIRSETAQWQGSGGVPSTGIYALGSGGSPEFATDPMSFDYTPVDGDVRPGYNATSHAQMALGFRLVNSSDIYAYGLRASSYHKLGSPWCEQTPGGCQDMVIQVSGSQKVHLYNLVSFFARWLIIGADTNGHSPTVEADRNGGSLSSLAEYVVDA